jgi:hypothetical protein
MESGGSAHSGHRGSFKLNQPEGELIEGARRGAMDELGHETTDANKILVF